MQARHAWRRRRASRRQPDCATAEHVGLDALTLAESRIAGVVLLDAIPIGIEQNLQKPICALDLREQGSCSTPRFSAFP